MAYRSHHCSSTLRFSLCISVFCTLLALSVLLPFMLFAPCPSNAPFPFCTFLLVALCLLLHTSITLNNHTHFFFVQHSYTLCAPCACNLLLSLASFPTPISSTSWCFCHFYSSTAIPSSVCHMVSLYSASSAHCECSA
jgi:hypothetical protein